MHLANAYSFAHLYYFQKENVIKNTLTDFHIQHLANIMRICDLVWSFKDGKVRPRFKNPSYPLMGTTAWICSPCANTSDFSFYYSSCRNNTSHGVTAGLSLGGSISQSIKTRLISYDHQQQICVLYLKGFNYTRL